MTILTHSLQQDSTYELRAHRESVAKVKKVTGGFRVLECSVPFDCQVRTMAATKVYVESILPAELLAEPIKAVMISIKDAFRICCMSHTQLYVWMKEAKRVWPEMPTTMYGNYFVRRHMEALAEWDRHTAAVGKRWLKENPTVGLYDKEEELRRLIRIYGADSIVARRS